MTDVPDSPQPADVDAPDPAHAEPRKVPLAAWITILALALTVCVIAGVVIGLSVVKAPPPSAQAPATDNFNDAMGRFKAGEYDRAAKMFRSLRRTWPNTPESRKAQIVIRCAQAHLAAAAKDEARLEQKAAAARDLLEEAAETDDLGAWAKEVLGVGAYLPSLNIASAQAEQTLAEAQRRLDTGDVVGARVYLKRRLPAVRFSQKQQDQLADLEKKIDHHEAEAEITSTLDTADQLSKARRYDRAAEAYADADAALKIHQALGHLSTEDVQKLTLRISEGQSVMQSAKALDDAKAQAKAARDNSQLPEEEKALVAAIAAAEKVDPGQKAALEARLDAVRTKQAFAAALAKASKETDPDKANAVLEDFIQQHPEHAEAKTALAALKTDRAWGQLIAEGDEAMQAGEWERAREKYKAAGEIKKNKAQQDRHRRAEYEILMQQARALRDEKKYEEALATADVAANTYPDAAKDVQAWRDDVVRQREYEAKMIQAATALRTGNLAEADKILAQMEQRPAVLAMRDEVAFLTHFQRGRSAMESRDYAEAVKAFREAQKHARPGKESADLARLLSRAESLLAMQRDRVPAPPPAPVGPQSGIGPDVQFPQPTFAPMTVGRYGYYPGVIPVSGWGTATWIGPTRQAGPTHPVRRSRMLPGRIRATITPPRKPATR